MIDFLEENKIKPSDSFMKINLKECNKCHHNDIEKYIACNFFPKADMAIINNQVLPCAFKYHNYYFLFILNNEFSFLYQLNRPFIFRCVVHHCF